MISIKINKRPVYTLILILVSVYGYTQTIQWATPPTYTSLEEYMGNLYKIRENGKTGIADIRGKIILPAVYDSITHFTEGYALALIREAGKWNIKGIINQQDFTCKQVTGKYYVTKHPFFSEAKLCVENSKGEQGFIGVDGELIIKCQYEEVHPFYEGRASVKQKNKRVVYINQESKVMLMEPGDGVIIFGSSFHNGEAVVYTMNRKGYVVNKSGKVIRSYNTSVEKLKVNPRDYTIHGLTPVEEEVAKDIVLPEDGIIPFRENNLYGYQQGNVMVLPSQLTEAFPFRSGFAKVKKDGKYGILKLAHGTFSGEIKKNVLEVTKGEPELAQYTVTLPDAWADSNIILRMGKENNGSEELAPDTNNGKIRNYSFRPEIAKNEKEKEFNFSVYGDGLLLWQDRQTLKFKYPVRVAISAPTAVSERADSDNNFRIYGFIENNSSQQLTVTATFYVNGRELIDTVTIAPGSRERVQVSLKVTKEETASVYIQLSNGLGRGQTRQIILKPFY